MPILPSLMLRTDQCIAAKYDGRLRWVFRLECLPIRAENAWHADCKVIHREERSA